MAEMAKFKANISFAHGEKMFFPKKNEVYEAPAKLVKAWAAVGYVEPIGEEAPEPKKPKKPKRGAENGA